MSPTSKDKGKRRQTDRSSEPVRQRRPLTSDDKIELALNRFVGLKKGKLTAISSLAKKSERDPAVVSRAIVSAFREGLVEIRKVTTQLQEPQRVDFLEEWLSEAFPKLLSAIVVDVRNSHGDKNSDDLKLGDHVHQQLGVAMARLISLGAVFRDGDVIGIGSGRGVYYTLESLGQLPPLRPKNVTLMSLAGTVYPRFHAKNINLRLDADFHVNLLARTFAEEVRIQLTSHRIVYDDPKLLQNLKRSSCLGSQRWADLSPSHALVGIGVLSPGHRFYDARTDPALNPEGILAPIHKPLTELVELLRKNKRSFADHCPVADIAHHLIYVPPEHLAAQISKETEDSIRQLIAAINSQLFTVSEEQLKTINTIMLVAGTKRKALAIKELLTNNSYNVRFICTDRAAAEEILRSVGSTHKG